MEENYVSYLKLLTWLSHLKAGLPRQSDKGRFAGIR